MSLVFLYLARVYFSQPAFHKIIFFSPQIYELGKVAVGNNMRGQGEPSGLERTGHAPEKQYSEFRAAENRELRSELFKSLQHV